MAAIALAGILWLGSGVAQGGTVNAAPDAIAAPQQTPQRTEQRRLPDSVRNAVRRDLARQLRISSGRLRVTKEEFTNWPNSCLGLPSQEELCAQVMVPGWRVEVSNGRQTWIYRTDEQGKLLRLETPLERTQIPPSAVVTAVQQEAARRLNVPVSRLTIVEAQPQTWTDGCLGLPQPNERCMQALVPGWEVMLAARGQRLVYRTTDSGTQVRLNEAASTIPAAELPRSVKQAVTQLAARETGIERSDLRIVKHREIEVNGCLNLPKPAEVCLEIAESGWQVTVAAGKDQRVYHSNGTGSEVRFNRAASQIANDAPVQPTAVLPENTVPLPQGAVFRALTTGGIAGRTFQVTLFSDGRLVQESLTRADGKGAPPAQTRQISPRQIEQFQQLLEKERFAQFDRLDYGGLIGSADVLVITLFSAGGRVRYADSMQSRLPAELQRVIQGWQRVTNGR